LWWNDIKGLFSGPEAPAICLVALAMLSPFLRRDGRPPGRPYVMAPVAFALAALVIARHFDFAIWEQNSIVIAVFVGVLYTLPPSK